MKNDKLPPNSQEAERGVLGCCLLDPNKCIGQCVEKFSTDAEEAFYDLRHRAIYSAMTQMFETSQPIDLITLQSKLSSDGLLENIGGISYLAQLQDEVPSAANLPSYLELACEKMTLRKLLKVSANIGLSVMNCSDVDAAVTEAEREILKVRPSQRSGSQTMKQLTSSALTKIEEMFASQGKISGLSTGLHALDKLTDGLHGGEMIVLAAFPSTGKTALALNIAVHNALQKIPVGIMSLEMQPAALTVRAICAEARVNLFDVRDGVASESDFASMASASARVSAMPMYIENCNGMSIGEITALARRMHQQHGIKMLVIDYLQLVSNPKSDSREQEVSSVSKGIKSIAMELNIPVMALSQLNDDGKLRESRAIGQDADSVWKLTMDGDKTHRDQKIFCDIDKNREGAVGRVPLLFMKQFTRFDNRSNLD